MRGASVFTKREGKGLATRRLCIFCDELEEQLSIEEGLESVKVTDQGVRPR